MTNSSIGVMIVVAVYLIFMLLIGFWCSKKNNDTSDFYLGGRTLGPYVTAMSAEASDMSSYLLMGLPGLAFLTGLADVGWTAVGLGLGTYLNWLIVAKRLRRYTARTKSITIPDFFSNRLGGSKSIVGIAALIIVVFFIPYTASGFAACGKLFSTMFGMDYMEAMLLSTVIIVGYTVLGGFLAASFTDFVQSIVMTIALLAVVIFCVVKAGGMEMVVENAQSLPGYLSWTQTHVGGAAQPYGPLTVVSTLAWGLGYFGMPHVLLRFMAIKDPDELKISRRVASVWVVISMFVAILIGVVGLTLVNQGVLPALDDSEKIVIEVAKFLSNHGIFAVIIAGLIISGILACTMSTADSQLLAASSSVSENILKDVFGIKLSQKATMIVARTTVLVISLIGIFLARNPESNIFKIVSFAWAGFGAAFGPLMLCALFWKRLNKYGAIAGMIVGGAMVFIWEYAISPLGGVFGIYELLPAFILSLIAIIVVSLITPAPSKEIEADFKAVKAGNVE